jgi:hypothetical protein
LTLSNYGTAPLNWSIDEDDTACDSPADIPWLSVAPNSGVTAPANSTPVDVTFDATGLTPATYNANLCVSSDDPVTPLVQVPVALTVTSGGAHFDNCVADTGNNASVAVPSDITILGGIPLESGDEIAVFRPDGSLCVGLLTWQGSSDAIAVWGDDTQTVPIDGIETGEEMHYYVWDASAQIEYPNAAVTYSQGDGIYAPNSFHILGTIDLNPVVTHDIALLGGWNLISSYVEPQDPALETVLAAMPGLTLFKNGAGQVYWPALNINQIGDWNSQDGYQVYMESPDTLSITGAKAVPEETPISMPAGWSMLGYLRDSDQGIDVATASISGQIYLAKNGAGQVYWPSLFINQIGDMAPGQGYQFYMNAPGTLTYPAN